MKNVFPRFLCVAALLTTALTTAAQTPVPYLVTSACPGSANNPSQLRMVPTSGAPVVVGTVNAGGVPLIVNGLGADNADPANVYAMSSVTTGLGALSPPRFYRIDLATAAATLLGTVGPPPTPAATFPEVGRTFVINQAADGGPNSNYFLTGATLIYNLATNTVRDVKLYLGEIKLAPVPLPATPTWRLTNTSSPAAATIIANLTVQANAYLASPSNNTLPDGGFQDIAYVPATGNIITYLGVERRFVVVSGITSPNPLVTVTTPAPLLPTGGSAALQIGSLFRDGSGRFFALRSSTGRAYQISPTTGAYLGVTYFTLLGCTLGDATTAPGQVVLPLTLTRFDATATASGVELAWETAQEKDVDQFVVERSADGHKWTDGPTAAATNQAGGSRYRVLDRDQPTATRYYRLRMEDRDGTRTWSEIQTVTAGGKAVTLLPAWPNPARSNLTVALSAPVAGEAELVNQLGQAVWRGTLTDGRIDLDVHPLPPGLHELVVSFGAGQVARQRVLIERD